MPLPELNVPSIEDSIVSTIADRGPGAALHINSINEAVHCNFAVQRIALEALCRKGYLTQHPLGHYRLTTAGAEIYPPKQPTATKPEVAVEMSTTSGESAMTIKDKECKQCGETKPHDKWAQRCVDCTAAGGPIKAPPPKKKTAKAKAAKKAPRAADADPGSFMIAASGHILASRHPERKEVMRLSQGDQIVDIDRWQFDQLQEFGPKVFEQ